MNLCQEIDFYGKKNTKKKCKKKRLFLFLLNDRGFIVVTNVFNLIWIEKAVRFKLEIVS